MINHPQDLPSVTPNGRKLGLWRMLRLSLMYRRARAINALIAFSVSAAITTALLTLYADLDAKMHREFRTFGANIIITATSTGNPESISAISPNEPFTAESLPVNALRRAANAAGPDALVAPFSYAVAETDRGSPIVVVGTDFTAAQQLDRWWQVTAWPSGPQDALLGQRAANFVADEHTVKLFFAGKQIVLHGTGRLRTGGDEDSRIFIPLAAYTKWTGAGASAIEVQVPGNTTAISAAIDRLRRDLPEMQVEPVRQLVEGETQIVGRTHALMGAALVLICLTVTISVLATMSGSVLERRRDFALMKALGGSQRQLLGMFLLEAITIAMSGVAAGFVLGSVAALIISEANFHTVALPRVQVLPAVLLLNTVIATVAALTAARVLRGMEPAALLKGQ